MSIFRIFFSIFFRLFLGLLFCCVFCEPVKANQIDNARGNPSGNSLKYKMDSDTVEYCESNLFTGKISLYSQCFFQQELEENIKICISQKIYREIIREKIKGKDDNTELCYVLKGNWKNLGGFPSLSEKKKSEKTIQFFKPKEILYKKIELKFKESIQNTVIKIYQKIVNKRISWVDFYAQYDDLGVLSELFFNFHRSSEIKERNQLLRKLGFIHLLNYNGVIFHLLFFFYSRFLLLILRFFTKNTYFSEYFSEIIASLLIIYFWILAGSPKSILRPLGYIGLRKLKIPAFASLILLLSIELLLKKGNLHEAIWHYYLAVGGAAFFKKTLYLSSWVFNAIFEIIAHGYTVPATIFLNTLAGFLLVIMGVPLFTLLHLLGVQSVFLIEFWNNILLYLVLFSTQIVPPFQVNASMEVLGVLSFLLIFWLKFIIRNQRNRLIVLLAMILFCVTSRVFITYIPSSSMNELVQLDVGQGDALWVRRKKSQGFVDVGSKFQVNAQGWFDFLLSNAIGKTPPFIFLTHLDEDHAGGLHKLVGLLEPSCVVLSQSQWNTLAGQKLWNQLDAWNIRQSVAEKGNCSGLKTVSLATENCNRFTPKANCMMSGVRIDFNKTSYFNFGDAPASLEVPMLEVLGKIPGNKNILKWSHHGSKTSGSMDLLEQLNPSEIWLSYGCQNKYGHPHFKTLTLAGSLKRTIRSTCREGSLKINMY